MAVQAMRSGAVDFIQKPYREQALLDSINAALAKEVAARFSSVATDDVEQRLSSLTGREREVLDQILSGLTSKEIARELGVSPRTVEAHRKNLLQKMGMATIKLLMLRFTSLEPGSRGT
jgi:two-component system response regulator DctR